MTKEEQIQNFMTKLHISYQKAAAERKQEDIPAYRRQAASQTQNQTQQSMKMMMRTTSEKKAKP